MSCKAVSSVCFQVLPCSWSHRNCAQKKVLGDHPGVSALPGHSGRALKQKQVRSSSSCWSCLLHNEHNPRRLFLQPVLRLVPCLEQSTSHPAPTTPHAVSRHTGVCVLVCGIAVSHSQRFFLVTSKPGLLLLFAPPP